MPTPTEIKTVVLGGEKVGKTTLVRCLKNNQFQPSLTSTIGADYIPYVIDSSSKLKIWDTAGQQRYLGLILPYVRDASIIFLCFDITNRQSFDDLNDYLQMTTEHAPNSRIILIGTKTDLNERRAVTREEAQIFCLNNQCTCYIETSSKENHGFEQLKESIKQAIAEPSLTQYRANTARYAHLWQTPSSGEDTSMLKNNLIRILDDYAKGDKGWALFFSGHWNRNRQTTKAVHDIVESLRQNHDDANAINDALGALTNLTMKTNGSLHRRWLCIAAQIRLNKQVFDETTQRQINEKLMQGPKLESVNRTLPIRD